MTRRASPPTSSPTCASSSVISTLGEIPDHFLVVAEHEARLSDQARWLGEAVLVRAIDQLGGDHGDPGRRGAQMTVELAPLRSAAQDRPCRRSVGAAARAARAGRRRATGRAAAPQAAMARRSPPARRNCRLRVLYPKRPGPQPSRPSRHPPPPPHRPPGRPRPHPSRRPPPLRGPPPLLRARHRLPPRRLPRRPPQHLRPLPRKPLPPRRHPLPPRVPPTSMA